MKTGHQGSDVNAVKVEKSKTALAFATKNAAAKVLKNKVKGGKNKTEIPPKEDSYVALLEERTEWDILSTSSKAEIDQLTEVLKAVKTGDFSVRFPYNRRGILRGVGELMNDSIPGKESTFTLSLPQNYGGSEAQVFGKTAQSDFPGTENNMLIPPLPVDADFTGKKILVMDDDIRNIFAINSVLESKKMKVFHAENGKLGIKLLYENPDVDLVIMDMMIPEMDGLTATQEIRKNPKFKRIPIISLIEKAMKGDREIAFSAGASDCVTKPVDSDQLLSIMHLWLNKNQDDMDLLDHDKSEFPEMYE